MVLLLPASGFCWVCASSSFWLLNVSRFCQLSVSSRFGHGVLICVFHLRTRAALVISPLGYFRFFANFMHMPNSYFQFKQFTVHQDRSAMKVSTDACIFGAWMAGICASPTSSGYPATAYSDATALASPASCSALPASPGSCSAPPAFSTALDIGAGTGLLSLMVAQQFSGVITAVEIDPSAASQASENFLASPWASRLSLVSGDIRAFSGAFDIIFSNPPFFENDLRGPSGQRNQARHDDTLGFTALLASVRRLLAPSGVFGVLIPYHRLKEFLALATDFSCQRITLVRQTPKHGFFRAMLMMKQHPISDSSTITDELTIQDSRTYTPECEDLLKPYYLHL